LLPVAKAEALGDGAATSTGLNFAAIESIEEIPPISIVLPPG
jgi:hypothetical protein